MSNDRQVAAVWFTPDAIREHFEEQEDEKMTAHLNGVSDKELHEAAVDFLWTADDLWEKFDGWCHNIVENALAQKQASEQGRRK